jgi:hypothetical protein
LNKRLVNEEKGRTALPAEAARVKRGTALFLELGIGASVVRCVPIALYDGCSADAFFLGTGSLPILCSSVVFSLRENLR